MKLLLEYGEFFLSSNCLVLNYDKKDWLKSQLIETRR